MAAVKFSERPWNDVTMNFVVGLPDCEGKNAILVVVHRLIKMRHLIAYSTIEG